MNMYCVEIDKITVLCMYCFIIHNLEISYVIPNIKTISLFQVFITPSAIKGECRFNLALFTARTNFRDARAANFV